MGFNCPSLPSASAATATRSTSSLICTYANSIRCFSSSYLTCSTSTFHLFRVGNFKTRPSFCLSAASTPTPSTSPSPICSSPIFLPFLEHEKEMDEEEDEKEEENEEDQQRQRQLKLKQVDTEDPFLRFFKSRSATPDPGREGRMCLQKNRRTSWHLASNTETEEETEPDIEEEVFHEEVEEEKEEERPRLSSSFSNPSRNIDATSMEILQIARDLPKNSTLAEQLDSYVGKLGKKDCVELLWLMAQEGLYLSCLYFFEWMSLQEPSLVTSRACSVLFPILGRARLSDKLMILFRHLSATKQFRDVHVYNAALSGLFYCGRYEDAWEVYESMEINNICPDHVTCCIMITIMRKNGNSAKQAWEFFARTNRKGINWSLEVVGALIKSFCDEGLKKEALIIQSEMEKKGISSNAIIYNTLMDAYSKSNQIEEAESLFAEMKEKGIKPISSSYNILMDAYSRRMQPEVIEDLMLEMQSLGLNPNVKSYTCLISAYGRQKKMSEMAANAFLRMKKVGIKPTSHSYTALIHSYSISGWHEKAYIAFENMKREEINPTIETYTALLDAFRRAGDTVKIKKIWKSMISEKIEGTRVTFNILLDGFSKQGHYIEARDVISEFGKIGFQPTVMTYNILMNAYARGGKHSNLPQLLKEMAALNLKPDSITYSTMIYAYVRVRDFKRAFYYHKQMVKSGQVPDAKSYQKLRSILDVKAAAKNRKDKSAILGIINSKLGMVKHKKKRKKDEFWKTKKHHPGNNSLPHSGH